MAQTFDVSLDRLGAVSKELSEALKSQRATEKEIRQTLLLLEEITVKFSMCMPDAPVTAEISRRYGTLRVRLEGELDHRRAGEIRAELDALIADPRVRRLVFDLSGLEFMDSSGIGMMIGRYKLMKRRGGSVAVSGPGARIDRLFQMSGVYQVVKRLA